MDKQISFYYFLKYLSIFNGRMCALGNATDDRPAGRARSVVVTVAVAVKVAAASRVLIPGFGAPAVLLSFLSPVPGALALTSSPSSSSTCSTATAVTVFVELTVRIWIRRIRIRKRIG